LKAAVLVELNAPLVVEEVEECPLRYGQVLVRGIASGICGAQLQEIAGEKGNGKFLPHLLGHEGCGTVIQIGLGVTTVAVGDRVVMHWRKGAGIEADFPRYVFRGREISSGKVTTFSEYSVVSENRVTAVSSSTPYELCALLGCGLSTALGTIERDAAVKFGESVLVIGVGGLGVNLILAARLANAALIAAVDVERGKESLALSTGADCFIHADDSWERFTPACDVVIDTTGNRHAISKGLALLKPSGRFVMVGQPKPFESVEIFCARDMFAGEGKSIKATQGGGFRPEVDIPRYVALHQAGRLNLSGLITDVVPLSEINRGVDLVRGGKAGRVLVKTSPF
jgi:S-(hydroxymethyl)glutathione dehydrogenase/alcohol dehydrogenase